jgi:hypothetical protein
VALTFSVTVKLLSKIVAVPLFEFLLKSGI